MAKRKRFRVFTCDRGHTWLDAERDPPERQAAILQEVVESGFWRELAKFPTDLIARLLPRLALPRHTRRLLQIWVEERAR